MIGDLLLKNQVLTELQLFDCTVDNDFLQTMVPGLLASRGLLQSLSLLSANIGTRILEKLRVIYNHMQILHELHVQGIHDNNDQQQGAVLMELNLNSDRIVDAAGGSLLQRILETMPHLKKLNVHAIELVSEGLSALFQQVGPASVLGRLQTLSMCDSAQDNAMLDQIVASAPFTVPLLELDLSHNRIEDTVGGESVARLLLRCGQLQELELRCNALDTRGARALAPASPTSIACKD